MSTYFWQSLRQLALFTSNDMGPNTLTATARQQLEQQMLDLLQRGMWQVLITSALIGPALVVWLTQPHIGWMQALVPAVLLLLISAERTVFLRRMARARVLNDSHPHRWANALALRVWVASCVIAWWCHYAIQTNHDTLVSQVLALVTILSAGAAAQFCSWPPVMWAAITPMLLGTAGLLLATGQPHRLVEGAFATVLWILIAAASLRFSRTLHQEAVTRLQNQVLLDELQIRRQEAELAHAAKTRFFAAASHDLRQPLQAMGMYLSVLQVKQVEPQSVQRMQQCMTAIDQLLEALLELLRMESGQLKAHPRPFPLQHMLDQLGQMYEGMAKQKGLQLRIHPSKAWAMSDPQLLERALSNLIANAIRYTQTGGVLLGVRPCDDHWRVCVVDTGIGIAYGAQDRIYEEFVQLDNPARDPTQGHGLGLAIVKRLVNLLGHQLTLVSIPAKGSEFSILVPKAQATPQPSSAKNALGNLPLKGRVLVVEDNAMARDALVQLLSDWGLDVQAVGDGERACEVLQAQSFDAVLSDWRLPGSMDGLSVLQTAHSTLPRPRAMALVTGDDPRSLPHSAQQWAVLRKPVRPLKLRSFLSQILSV